MDNKSTNNKNNDWNNQNSPAQLGRGVFILPKPRRWSTFRLGILSSLSSVAALFLLWIYIVINLSSAPRDVVVSLYFWLFFIYIILAIPTFFLIRRNWRAGVLAVVPFVIIIIFYSVTTIFYYMWPSMALPTMRLYVGLSQGLFAKTTGYFPEELNFYSPRLFPEKKSPSIPLIPNDQNAVTLWTPYRNVDGGFALDLPQNYKVLSSDQLSIKDMALVNTQKSDSVIVDDTAGISRRVYVAIIRIQPLDASGIYAPQEGLYGYDANKKQCWVSGGGDWGPIDIGGYGARGCNFGNFVGDWEVLPFNGYLIPDLTDKSVIEIALQSNTSEDVREKMAGVFQTFRFIDKQTDRGKDGTGGYDPNLLINSWHDVNFKPDENCPSFYSIIGNYLGDLRIDEKNEFFVSPKGGIYSYGDQLSIVWRKDKIDVYAVSLVPVENLYNRCLGLFGKSNIYRRSDTDDSVSTNGKFNFAVPLRKSIDFIFPGEYSIGLSTHLRGNKVTILSNPIEIRSSLSFHTPVAGGFDLEIVGKPEFDYSAANFSLFAKILVRAKSSLLGVPFRASEGFSATAKMYQDLRLSNNFKGFAYGQDNLRDDGTWLIEGTFADIQPGKSYRLLVDLWCSNLYAVCAERFSPGQSYGKATIIFDIH